jgi:hypothetical protein
MMMRSNFLAPAVLLLLPQASYGWLPVVWKQVQATTAAIALTAALLGDPPIQQPSSFGQDLQSTLVAPTQDRPQIEIPGNLQQDKDSPILEALVG